MTSDNAMGFISKIPISSRVGVYGAHRKVYESVPNRPVFRRNGELAIVVSADRPAGKVEVKPYTPFLSKGERLRFVLRSDVSKSRFQKGKRGDRYDPILAERFEGSEKSYSEIAQEIGLRWLERCGERNGFIPSDIFRFDYEQIKFVRPTDRRAIRFTAIDFEGILQVVHPEKITNALLRGIGRGKAFGLGLLLVRRP